MRRREVITMLGGAAAPSLLWPLAARAQQPMPVVAFFNAGSPAAFDHLAQAFREGLRETGFIAGQNIVIEYRWAEDRYDQLPAMAADLVERRVAVIAASPRAVVAAKAATTTIPIVFMSGSDPVRAGLVANLNRPGGNLTGVTLLAADLTQKRFGLLHDLVPGAGAVGVLSDASAPVADFPVQEAQAAAHNLGVQTRVMSARTESEIETAFATFAQDKMGAVFVTSGFLFFNSFRAQLAASAARHRLPAAYELREHVVDGGLMSYGPSLAEAFRQVGRYTGRILKGEKPGDLPVMLPTKFEFVINQKAAKALGLDIPGPVLAGVDEVIE